MADPRPMLAVLIDADNVGAKYAADIMNEVKGIGEPAVRRVYGDWSNAALKGWQGVIHELGLIAEQETANTTGKNASDIGFVIGAMDLLHSGKYDGFVIVSSDSDYTALASRLREEGRMVVGIGEETTPKSLVNVCNRFIFIENISAEAAKEAAAQARAEKKPLASPIKPLPLIKDAMDKLDSEDGWYQLAAIGSKINAARPEFDPRSYGHPKLSAMMKNLNSIETRVTGTQMSIRLKS